MDEPLVALFPKQQYASCGDIDQGFPTSGVAREAVSPLGLDFCSFIMDWTLKMKHPPPIPSRKSWIRACSVVYVAREVPANVACGPHTHGSWKPLIL
ncbi:hypothetical protein M8J77_008377 [Diaphorina citri]|nr:hypothetical protein M8J77_008377 [Diaphorina citri]